MGYALFHLLHAYWKKLLHGSSVLSTSSGLKCCNCGKSSCAAAPRLKRPKVRIATITIQERIRVSPQAVYERLVRRNAAEMVTGATVTGSCQFELTNFHISAI